MKTLLDLSDELILQIANELNLIADLNSLVQTNTYLHNILINTLLQCHIHDDFGLTSLFYAAGYGNEASVKLLLEKGRFKVYKGECPRVYYQGPGRPSEAVVRFVLASGFRLKLAPPNYSCGDCEAYRALHWAVHIGSWRMAELVLDHEQGSCIDMVDKHGQTALCQAAAWGNTKVVKVLLNNGTKLSSKRGHNTPLQVAVNSGKTSVARILLEREARLTKCVSWVHKRGGSYVSSGDFVGRVPGPIYLATIYSNESLVKLWLKKEKGLGSILDHDQENRTALHISARTNTAAGVAITKLLLDKIPKSQKLWQCRGGKNSTIEDKQGRTPLHDAAMYGYGSVEYLLKAGLYVDYRDKDWRTPLHNHLRKATRPSPVIELLLKGGANVKAKDFDGRTPLHWAARNSHIAADAIPILIDYGTLAVIHSQDIKGKIPLHLAAERDNKEAFKLLIQHGSHTDVKDKRGNTPLDLADDSEDSLEQHGDVVMSG